MKKNLVITYIATFIFIIIFFLIPLPYYAVFPGDTINMGKVIDGNKDNFYAVYSNVYQNPYGFFTKNDFQISVFVYALSKIKSIELHEIPKEYENITDDQIKSHQYNLLNQSLKIAKTLAFDYLGNDSEVNISFGELAGSSGSLILALEIIQQYGEEDLVKGRKIAGTGDLDLQGNVLEVGSVEQKLEIIEENGFDIFLVPSEITSNKVKIILVNNLTEAVEKLKEFS